MNISVDEINIVNDGMYEIYTKFGMKIAIDVLKKRFSNITKEDTKTIKLLSCFVNYMKKKGATVTNIKDLNDATFKTYMDFVIEERSKKKEELDLNTYIKKDNIINPKPVNNYINKDYNKNNNLIEKQDINLDKTQVFSSKDIKEAANVAQASEFIEKLDNKYNSLVARSGTNLSGGQKQRLSIARAIARNPEIYIFDDSFSALDYKTDSTLRRELREYTKDATVMIVAQRIGTILNADKIVVLDNGKCVGVGTHKELMKKCKVYKEIALSQVSKEELENV